MGDKSVDGLPYGHFREAFYHLEETGWRFERSLSLYSTLQALTQPKIAIPATLVSQDSDRSTDDTTRPSERRQNQTKRLVDAYPELQPASDLLLGLARVSEATEHACSRYDPVKGPLCAFGTITDQRLKELVAVVSLAAGPSGSNVRVAQIHKRQLGWDDSKNAWLEVLDLVGEGATWEGPGVPVQSIVFARPIDRSRSYMAVRLITETLIFQPILRKSSSEDSSVMDTNLLLRLHILQTGGSPHADVAFNPYYTRQLAIIDQTGHWSAWELDARHGHDNKMFCRGSLTSAGSRQNASPVDDGWGRILWIGGPTIVAVCNRRKLRLCNVANDNDFESQTVKVGLENGIGWILDMRPLPGSQNLLAVLTSTQILVFVLDSDRGDEIATTVVGTIRHLRNPEDITLSLHTIHDNEDTILVVRSCMTATATSYRVQLSDLEPLSVGDPTELFLSHLPGYNHSSISSIISAPISIKNRTVRASGRSVALQYLEHNIGFHSLIVLHSDLSLHQAVYFSSSARRSFDVRRPTWERSHWKSPKESTEGEFDDFILDDSDSDLISNDAERKEPMSWFVQHRRAQNTSRSGDEWTISYEHAIRRLFDVDISDTTGVKEILEDVQGQLQDINTEVPDPIRTLREFAEGELAVRDIAEVNEALQTVRLVRSSELKQEPLEDEDSQQPQVKPRSTIQTVELPPFVGLDVSDGSDLLLSVYNVVNDGWISSLAGAIPEATRSVRDQLASRMATQVALAGHVIRVEQPEEKLQHQSQPELDTKSQVWDLPMRNHSTPSSARATPSVYFDTQSQLRSPTLPTASPSETPSGMSGSSRRLSSAAPEVSRLSQYTTFSQSAPPPLSRALNRVLSHWIPGADPSEYDWLNTSRRITQRDEEHVQDEQMTEKERQRMHRRTERYVRRQQREAEASQRQQMLSSQVPQIFSASQPSNSQPSRLRGDSQNQSQSQGQSQLFPASQVLPGRHGGRPPRKKRRPGF